jgi:hypothetical protein
VPGKSVAVIDAFLPGHAAFQHLVFGDAFIEIRVFGLLEVFELRDIQGVVLRLVEVFFGGVFE